MTAPLPQLRGEDWRTITTRRSRWHTPEVRAAARQLGRRRFLTLTAAAAALAFAVDLPATGTAAATTLDAARIDGDPFTLQARADFKTVPYVTTTGAPISTAASFVTEVGDQGLKPA